MTESRDIACIVGVGPGLGEALAKRFAREGFALALLARSPDHYEAIAAKINADGGEARGFECDAGEPESVRRAFAHVRKALGNPGVLIYNAGSYAPGGFLEIDPAKFEAAWRVNCYGGFLSAREVLPAMLDAGAGTLLFTGATAALRGGNGFAGLAVGKFGLRALAQSLAREFGPRGIHVAHAVIDGQIATPAARERQPDRAPETFLAPQDIAEAYWHLHAQPRSAWTLEMDLRPHVESF